MPLADKFYQVRSRLFSRRDPPTPDNTIYNVRFHTGYGRCNYSCEYCVAGHGSKEGHRDQEGDFIMIDRGWDGERFERIVHNIKALPIRMNIRLRVPGEISTNKLLMAGAKSLADSPNVHSINLLTNLSLRKDQFERLFQGFDDSKVAIVGSYHPTEVKNPDQWIETALYANDRFDFAICLVAWPPLLADLSERKRDLESKGFTVFVQAFIGDYEDRPYPGSYTDTERAALKPLFYSRHDYEFLLNLKQPDLCNAGYRSFYIAEDGEVFPCGNGAWEFSMGNLSNSPEIKLGDGARPCPFQTCQCDTENMNTQVFHQNYTLTGINQHKYTYRLKAKAKTDPAVDEWAINY